MKIRSRYMFLCRNVEIQQGERDSVSFQDFFDTLGLEAVPSQVEDQFHLVLGIDGVPKGKEINISIVLRDPKGKKKYLRKKHKLKGEDEISPVIYILTLNNFPAESFGVYYFDVYCEDNLIAQHPLRFLKGGD